MRSIQKTLAPVLAAALLAGCAAPAASSGSAVSSAAAAQTTETAAEPLRVVTTIFPLYDWVRQTAGEDAPIQLTLLLDGGTDLHSYQPSAQDMAAIADCDLFIYVGGESDAWVEDALAGADNPDRRALNLLDLLGTRVYEEETVEGMEPEEEEDHDHEEHAVDEHIWTSLRNAQELTAAIGDVLGELDPAHADQYTANAIAYGARLAALDGEYASLTASAPVKTLLFGDRFPFRYLVEDYALDYYAAFPGCSADTEASFETVAFLAVYPANPALGIDYFYTVMIQDATACCQAGMEFVWDGGTLPAEGTNLTVTGTFASYDCGGLPSYHIVANTVEVTS